jgi:hypothetical protein
MRVRITSFPRHIMMCFPPSPTGRGGKKTTPESSSLGVRWNRLGTDITKTVKEPPGIPSNVALGCRLL